MTLMILKVISAAGSLPEYIV